MFPSNASKATMMMIYLGTLLISILSFFTTYQGMNIILSWQLALLGSLGLQTAMLGIAWNLIKLKDGRGSYILAFSIAASFSVFFSYASFDTGLKNNTRPLESRDGYYEAAMPVLAGYSAAAKNASLTSQYQVNRLNSLVQMEQEKGWATIIDEGSQDKFIQSIIDGARRTVDSWRQSTGTDYRQGKGKGIIVNYLESRLQQANSNYYQLNQYAAFVDSLTLTLSNNMTVAEQHELLNRAYVNFPASIVELVNPQESAIVAAPPLPTDFAEKPSNTQQALMMVVNDLYPLDQLSFIALMLAIAIDFIVLAIALAGSHIMAKSDLLFERLEGDTLKRMKSLNVDDVDGFTKFLDTNLHAYKKAAQYGKDMDRIVEEYQNAKNRIQLVSRHTHIQEREDTGFQPVIIKERSRLDKWLNLGRAKRRERRRA